MRYTGKLFTFCYRTIVRLKDKAFSVLIAGAFASFGKRSVLMTPIRLSGEGHIAVGSGVYVGSASWLQASPDGHGPNVTISIGDGTSIAGACVISGVRSIVLEQDVLLARNVYISDHIHRYDQRDKAILSQGVDKVAPVLIESGAWLGQNVVICPGVTIGRGAVVGANSVVNSDIPAYSVAAGAPARIVKRLEAAVGESR